MDCVLDRASISSPNQLAHCFGGEDGGTFMQKRQETNKNGFHF